MSSLDGPRRGNYGSPRDSNQNTNNQGNPYNNNNTSSSNADPFGNGNNNGSNNNNNQPPQPQQQQTTRRRGQAAPKPSPPIDPILWVRSTLARDPFVEPSKTTQWNTFFLMTLVQSIGVSPENGYEMMGANFENLGKLLRSGVPNSGFFLVRRLCQAMYHSTGHMLVLFESDVQNNIAVLAALQMGILSDDREVSVMLMHTFRNMAHRNSNASLQENFWSWFETREGGLGCVSLSLSCHKDEVTRKAAIEMIGHMCPSQAHASRLFSHVLSAAFPDTADYLLIVHDLLQFFQQQNSQMAEKSGRSNMITLSTIRHIVKFAFLWAQSRQSTPVNGTRNGNGGKNQPVDERSRCAALSLLAELWLLMDVSVTDGDEKKRAEVMKAILGLLKRAARETASVTVKITANACLFVLLEAFVQNQRPYAPYVYKTLIFSLIESKADNQSLREFMMASMSQSMNTLRQIPVGILIEPLVKQCSLTGYNEDDLQLLDITASHPRLGVKHALIILDLIGKIVLNDPVYCRMCWNPLFSLLRRFPRQLQLQNFVLRFCKVALKQLLQNELRASAAYGGDFTAGKKSKEQQQRINKQNSNEMASFNISDDIQDVLDEDSEHVLRRVFYQVDTNQSNSIEKKELLQFMQRGATPLHQACERFPRLKPLLKPSTYAAVLGRMDTSNTGRVTFEEFRTFAVSLSRQSSRADSRSYNGNNTNGANGQGTLQFDDEDNSVTNSNDNYRNDFSNEYDAEMSAIQGKRVMIIGVLGRLVNLRNSDVNASILPIIQAAKRNLMELYLNLPNLQDTDGIDNMVEVQATMKLRDDMCTALDQMCRICNSTTPPTDIPCDEVGTIKQATIAEERMWQKASIDDLDQSVANVRRGANSILDQAMPDEDNESNHDIQEVRLARVLRKLTRKLHNGGNDLSTFRDMADMTKKDFQRQLRVVLQMKTTRKEIELLFNYFDHDKSQTLDGGEIMRHFFDSKHIDDFIKDVVRRFPDEMKWKPPIKKTDKGARTNGTSGGQKATRNPDGKWGGQGLQNHLLNNFLTKIDDVLLYRRPDLTNFKRQALTKSYFSQQIKSVFGIKHSSEELDVLFNFFDKDGDGTLDYVEVFRRFFAKTKTGRRAGAPQPTVYAGQVFRYTNPDQDVVSDDEDEEVDQHVQEMIDNNLPQLLRGDGELATVLRKVNAAWDAGGADPLEAKLQGLDLRGFRGRNLTKLQFRRQCKRALGIKLSENEVNLIYQAFDADGGGTMEYNEFLLGMKGPLYSALERIRVVLEEDRIFRDMKSFKGKDLDKTEFQYQCKAVLGVDLLPEELNAVFEFFDKDGGGTIDYGEILLKFSRRDEMDIAKAGHKHKKKFKPGFQNHRVNLDRVKRRREREIARKNKTEERKRLRSARIRKNLRQSFEDRLANRINLGIREERIPISERQNSLINTHQSQMKATKRQDTKKMITKVEHDEQNLLNKRPPTPPQKNNSHENSQKLFTPWLICMKKVFKMYVLQSLAFKQTKRYAYDEILKARSSMDKTTWLRFLTDFQLLPSLVSLSEATFVFTRNNFSLSPSKWDLREGGSTTIVAPQTRPVGMSGAQQFAVLSFSDFISCLQGVTGTRASIFTCLPNDEQRAMALGCWLRKASNDWNESLDVTKYRLSVTKSSNSGDSKGLFLQHGAATPTCMLKLQRMYGDQRADYNWWYDYTTPETVIFEHRYSDLFRKNVPESHWMAMEMIEIILAKSVRGLHILQPIQRELPPEENQEDEEDSDGGLENGNDEWGEEERQKTPAYVNRLYQPKTPPTWPSQDGSLGFGVRTTFENRKGLSDMQQKKWNQQATMRKTQNNIDQDRTTLAYLGEKARNEMPLKWVVTAKWATEIIVRIADDCTTGEAQMRLQEVYDVDMDNNENMETHFIPINKRNPVLVGLPEIPLEERVKEKPNLKPKETEKTVDRKLREELDFNNKQKSREKALRIRRKEIRKVLKAKRKAKREKKEEDIAFKKDHLEEQTALNEHKAEYEKSKRAQLKLDIAAYKIKRAEKEAVKRSKEVYDQDVAKRHYQIRFKSYKKQGDIAKAGTGVSLEDLNRARNEAKMKRRQSMIKLQKAKGKEQEERNKMEENLRKADNPLDKLSIKLHFEIRTNLKKLSSLFSEMDNDGSGSLTYKEFRKGLFNVGVKLSTKEAQILCEGLDKDGDGEINYKELARFLAQTKGGEESAAMQIQARIRANKVKTKTLAQKKQEFEENKAKEHKKAMLAKTAEWEAEQEKLANAGEFQEFHVGERSPSNSVDESALREKEEEEKKAKKEQEAAEKKKKDDAALALKLKNEKEAEDADADEDDPFGMDSDDDDTKSNGGEELGESGKSNSTEEEEATPAQIANWDSEA